MLVHKEQNFMSFFDENTGYYMRTGILQNGQDTGVDPFMASFPELLDIGIMGHCLHGKSGRCLSSGVECYQDGLHSQNANMTLEDFTSIVEQCAGRTFQFALGGCGDPDEHEHFEEILRLSRETHIVPNFTTSGFGFTEEKARLCAKYCGAVAVSWYRSPYTEEAIRLLLKNNVKTNIHYVLGKNSIDEAIDRLKCNDFPKGINAVIFLLHKPAGQGTKANMLSFDDPKVAEFFAQVDKRHPFKVGMDSCNVPGAIHFCNSILPESLDTCEGGRYSCYIGADMIMVPCSFDQKKQYEVSLGEILITEAWNSESFERFRNKMRNACPGCEKKELCMGGCPLMPEIVFCDSKKRYVKE